MLPRPARRARPALRYADARLLSREDGQRCFGTVEGLAQWATLLAPYNGRQTHLISHAPLLNLAAILPSEAQGIAMVRALVADGFDPNPPFTGQDWPLPVFGLGLRIQDTPLTAAIRAERPALVKALLDLGADPCPSIPRHLRKLTLQAMLLAAEREGDSLQHLLDAGANPNEVDPQGQSALVRAVLRNATGNVQQLIAAGADVTAPAVRVDQSGPWGGYSILHAAMPHAPLDIVDALIAAGAPLSTRDPWTHWTPLAEAVAGHTLWHDHLEAINPQEALRQQTGRLQRVERLLNAGAPVDETTGPDHWNNVHTPLFWACSAGDGNVALDWDMIDLLVGHGADLNHPGPSRVTPRDALDRSMGLRPQFNRIDAFRLAQTLRLQEAQDLRRTADGVRPTVAHEAVPPRPRARL